MSLDPGSLITYFGENKILLAKRLLARVTIPTTINKDAIRKYIKKALRTKTWKTLKPENRALLIALLKWGGEIKSRLLKKILQEILLEIELHTLRGKAIFYGFLISIKKKLFPLKELLQNISRTIVIGISYLNNPPICRPYNTSQT
ncbi:MAG: hypothetical protein ACP5IZ_11390 [Thermoprotei archaeon]